MTTHHLAFVGDVHGNIHALNGILALVESVGVVRVVFLGDYINKGPNSADVVQTLLEAEGGGGITLLRGNHEATMLDALDSGNLAPFLKIGGAATIRSYTKRPVAPDVLSDFRSCLPSEHVDFLRRMQDTFEDPEVIASHQTVADEETRFQVSAHVPVGDRPKIRPSSAYIDTGCGSSAGRLTALIWPSLTYVQVDNIGQPIESDTMLA